MQWLADLLARLGTHGAYANASRGLAEEQEAAAQLDRFLLRFGHRTAGPADEPATGRCTRVA